MWFTIIGPKWGQIVLKNRNKLVLAHTPAYGVHCIGRVLSSARCNIRSQMLTTFSTVDIEFKWRNPWYCCFSTGVRIWAELQ